MKHLIHLQDNWFIKRGTYSWRYEEPDTVDPDEFSRVYYYNQRANPNCDYVFSSRRVTR